MAAQCGAQQPERRDQRRAAADAARQQIAVAATIFGQAGHAQIDPERDRALHQWPEQRVVDHHQRAQPGARANRVGNVHDQGDVDDRGGRVGRGLDHDQLERPERECFLDRRLDAGAVAPVGKFGMTDAEGGHQAGIEPVGAAIDRAAEHHAVAGAQMRKRDRRMRRHAAVEHGGGLGPVERRQSRLDHVEPGVAEPRIDMTGTPDFGAGALEIRLVNVFRLPGRGVSEGRGHIDGRLGGIGGARRIIARAHGERFGTPDGGCIVAHRAARSR